MFYNTRFSTLIAGFAPASEDEEGSSAEQEASDRAENLSQLRQL